MNNKLKQIFKIFIKIIFGIIVFIILLYIGLWIYTINYVSKDFKEYYNNSEIINLSENQYKLIWYTLSEDKTYKFKWRPFIIDIISILIFDENVNIIDLYTAEVIISKFGYRYLNSANLRHYSLTRYINYKNNWKKCISIIVSDWYYGNEIRNLKDAAEYYFNNDIKNITDEELVYLIISPPYFEWNREYYELKMKKIIKNF